MEYNNVTEKITADLLRPVRFTKGFIIWMTGLTVSLFICLYAYVIQLKLGLGVTGMGDIVSWGMYIANFVFFVASSLIGMLISAVLGLSGAKWITPLTRIAEIIALAFASIAGVVIITDMGRPERLLYVFTHARVQSPIFWDVTVVTTYVVISALLVYLPLIPDLVVCLDLIPSAPKWQRWIYKTLALNWKNHPTQRMRIQKSIRILLILIVPVALSIHTVTSWLFASTLRSGWNSTIFGPYYVTGAFVTGCAAVIIAMYFFRNNYKLYDYITDDHFDKMGKILVLVSLVYLYFNINEFLVPGYKLEKADAIHLQSMFEGRYALMFWSTQILGLVLPTILLLFKSMRKALPMLLIAIVMFVAAWFKRYIIVIPTMEHPFLPIQYVPERVKFYTPTLIETAITLASFIMVLMIITILAKIFPIIPVMETIHEREHPKV
jgi:molybdopterin-containing oxidoreductase family membrane subunit